VRRPLALLALLLAPAAHAQRFTPSGGAYLDYAVRLAPDSSRFDQGFALRRAWAAATVKHKRTTARLRLETDAATVPRVRLYEAYVRLDSLAGAHRVTMGLLQMYGIQQAEGLWAHRFLARTLASERGGLSSRDLGVQLDGPAGPLHYAVGMTSGQGVAAQLDDGVHLSAALAASNLNGLHTLATVDYERRAGNAATVGGLAAALGPVHRRLGVEAFVQRGDDGDREGLAVFAVRRVSDRWRLVGRLDATHDEGEDDLLFGGILGAVYRHDDLVEIAPALVFATNDGSALQLDARLTASLRF